MAPAKTASRAIPATKASAKKAAPKRPAAHRARSTQRVLVMVGTRKGAFLFQSDLARQKWQVSGPHFPGWSALHLSLDQRTGSPGTLFAALHHDVYGPNVHRSTDLGQSWQMAEGPAFPPDAGLKVARVWRVEAGHAERPGEVWAGADPGALFKSEDGGQTWKSVDGLTHHPTREAAWFPGAGGLMVHCIIPHPTNPNRLFVAISAAGVFRSDDGGQTWEPKNRGTQACFLPEGQQWPAAGQCCHHLVMDPANPDVLYQQNHCGVYRTDDAGENWTTIENGLPTNFGFPIGVLPRRPRTLFLVPLISADYRYTAEGQMAVYRSQDGGDNWRRLTRGLPGDGAYLNVLREGLATDACDPGGVYVGTSTGQIFGSRDEGSTWSLMADFLPPVYAISTAVL